MITDGGVLVLIVVVGVVVWIVYGNSRDRDKRETERVASVQRLRADNARTQKRPQILDMSIYNLPILAPPPRDFHAHYSRQSEVVETWHFAEQDTEDPERDVENRFPIWMFLLREKGNAADPLAIAVYSLNYQMVNTDIDTEYRGHRQIGYLNPLDAREIAPVLDRFPATRIPVRIHYTSGYQLICILPNNLEHRLVDLHPATDPNAGS